MFHGVSSFPVSVPERLYPTAMSQYDTSAKGQTVPRGEPRTEDEPQGAAAKSQSSKKAKKKKAKKSPEKSNKTFEDKTTSINNNAKVENEGQGSLAAVALDLSANARPTWSKISSSESDYSDTEGSQGSRMRSYNTKVRQCALACLHTVIKVGRIPGLVAVKMAAPHKTSL